MTSGQQANPDSKISREFASRLNRFDRSRKLRVIVMLMATAEEKATDRRSQRAARKKIAEKRRDSAGVAIPDIDRVLRRHGGKRLVSAPTALGSIQIETTVEGVRAIADLDRVKAVLEDQKIFLQR